MSKKPRCFYWCDFILQVDFFAKSKKTFLLNWINQFWKDHVLDMIWEMMVSGDNRWFIKNHSTTITFPVLHSLQHEENKCLLCNRHWSQCVLSFVLTTDSRFCPTRNRMRSSNTCLFPRDRKYEIDSQKDKYWTKRKQGSTSETLSSRTHNIGLLPIHTTLVLL